MREIAQYSEKQKEIFLRMGTGRLEASEAIYEMSFCAQAISPRLVHRTE